MYIVEEEDKRFYINKSTIEGAGYGCFAKELIPKGDFLEIIGVMVRPNGLADQCTHYAKRYKFAASEEKNMKIVPMGFGGIVNHTDDSEKQNVQLAYLPRNRSSKRSQHSTQAVYLALRDIQPDEELLGFYGEVVDKEIKKFKKDLDSVAKDKEEWDRFLSYNLYNLGDIVKELKNDS